MKNYNSTTERTWIERVRVELTEEEKTLLMSTNESEQEARKELMVKIKSDSEKEVSSQKATELTKLYNTVKPKLKEGDVYQLIAIDVTENNSGILNCRVNDEHVQVRF